MDGQSSVPTTHMSRTFPELHQEMARVEKMIEQVSQLMQEPGLGLGVAMRLNRHLLELLAYRSGIEYAAIVLRMVRDVVPVARCTLFLVDHKEKLLRSFIAQGVDDEIRLPLGHGVAGTVAVTGVPLDVTDAQRDHRFEAEFDVQLGYRTHDVFCMPVFNREGTVKGVLELLNRSQPLSDDDKEFLSGMCHDLGMALHNAWIHHQLDGSGS